MREYIFGAIILSLITAIAIHLTHTSLSEPARVAMGLVLLLFVASPIASVFNTILNLKIPETGSEEIIFKGGCDEVGEEAFCQGVASLLSDRYSVSASGFIVICEGFNLETLSADIVSVTLIEEAAKLDYREIKAYIEDNLKVKECDVKIEVS